MKVRKLVGPLMMSCAVLTACEEKPPEVASPVAEAAPVVADKPPEAPPAPKEPAMLPPADACAALASAFKAKDDAKIMAGVTPETMPALADAALKEHVGALMAAATCGAAKVEGDKATVSITSGEAVQEVPFIKSAEGWKMDGPAYLTAYPMPKKGKGGAGKGHPAAGKGKKHKH